MAHGINLLIIYLLAICYTQTVQGAVCPDGTKVSNTACCPLVSLRKALQNNMFGKEACPPLARSILRLAFHDAMGFSQSLKDQGKPSGGGADGSILSFIEIEERSIENSRFGATVSLFDPLILQHDISTGDLLHFAAAVGLSTCPGAPRLNFLMGRPPPRSPAPEGTIPHSTDTVSPILDRFADINILPNEVVALMASHSIAAGHIVGGGMNSGKPLDSTPGIFDTQFFLEVLLRGTGTVGVASKGESFVPSPIINGVRLQSDFSLARDPRTTCAWEGLINEQDKMKESFKAAMAKLSVVGQNTTNLIDCSDLVPTPPALPRKQPSAKFPAMTSKANLQRMCPSPFRNDLTTARGRVPATVNDAECQYWNIQIEECLNGGDMPVCCDDEFTADETTALDHFGIPHQPIGSGFIGVSCALCASLTNDTNQPCASDQVSLCCPGLFRTDVTATFDNASQLVGVECSSIANLSTPISPVQCN